MRVFKNLCHGSKCTRSHLPLRTILTRKEIFADVRECILSTSDEKNYTLVSRKDQDLESQITGPLLIQGQQLQGPEGFASLLLFLLLGI